MENERNAGRSVSSCSVTSKVPIFAGDPFTTTGTGPGCSTDNGSAFPELGGCMYIKSAVQHAEEGTDAHGTRINWNIQV